MMMAIIATDKKHLSFFDDDAAQKNQVFSKPYLPSSHHNNIMSNTLKSMWCGQKGQINTSCHTHKIGTTAASPAKTIFF